MGNKLNLEYVSNVVKDDYKRFKEGDVVLLKSQVGTGKTYFVTEMIIPSLKAGEKLLYLCNRKKLSKDIKIDLLKAMGKTDELPKTKEDEEKLSKREIFGNVTVLNYQRLEGFLNYDNFDLNEFKWIVCDEIHYAINDSSFNHRTFLTKQALIDSKLSKSIKIFISATMGSITPLIKKDSYNNKHEYNTGTDFSYLKPKYFKRNKDVVQLIVNDKSDDKWLIFVTSKQSGERIKSDLLSHEIDCVSTHSGTRGDYIIDQKFNSKVYICTKHIDNGVNIVDEQLKNLIIMAYDETTFIQEVGRCRVDIENARDINLYIPTFNSKNFKQKLEKNYLPKLKQVEEYETDKKSFQFKYRNDHSKVHNDLFVLDDDNNWIRNEEGISALKEQIRFAELMINKFKEDAMSFVKEQLDWLSLGDTYSEDSLVEKVVSDEEKTYLHKALNSLVGIRLFAEQQQKLSEIILKQLVTVGTDVDYRTTKLTSRTLESIIRDQLNLPFAVSNPKRDKRRKLENGEDNPNRDKNYITITKL